MTNDNKILEDLIYKSEKKYKEHKQKVDTKTKELSEDIDVIQKRIKLIQQVGQHDREHAYRKKPNQSTLRYRRMKLKVKVHDDDDDGFD